MLYTYLFFFSDYEAIKKTLNDPMAYEESIHEISEKTSKKLKMLYCPDKRYESNKLN